MFDCHDEVRIVAPGSLHGQLGVVVSRDEACGWYFVSLNRHEGDPTYRTVQFGPFTAKELQRVVPARARHTSEPEQTTMTSHERPGEPAQASSAPTP